MSCLTDTLTSTKSSQDIICSSQSFNKPSHSETSTSQSILGRVLELPQNQFAHMESGQLPSLQSNELVCSYIHTEPKSLMTMSNSLLGNLWPSHTQTNMTMSSTSTEPLDSELPDHTTCSSRPLIISMTSSPTISSPVPAGVSNNKSFQNRHAASSNPMCPSVFTGTMAAVHQKPVDSNMHVSSVVAGTKKRTAESINRSSAEKVDNNEKWKRPKWVRGYLWSENEISYTPSVTATETAPPLPDVPNSELILPILNKTIRDHPELFKIITPVNIDTFEHLLETHPNHPLVNSVC